MIPPEIQKQIQFFIETPHCLVIKLDNNDFALAYITNRESLKKIDGGGDTLFIQYLSGALTTMLPFIQHTQIKYIAYDRRGKPKCVPLDKLTRRAM